MILLNKTFFQKKKQKKTHNLLKNFTVKNSVAPTYRVLRIFYSLPFEFCYVYQSGSLLVQQFLCVK